MPNKFWTWYEARYSFIAPATALLFLLQLVHLYWLMTNIVFLKAFGQPFWSPGPVWDTVIALVDYTEIPAIISSSLLYIHQYQRGNGEKWRSLIFLLLINSQWIHLFWITDEVIYAQFTGAALVAMPIWLSSLAISIDYLEIPVMIDSARKAIASLRKSSA